MRTCGFDYLQCDGWGCPTVRTAIDGQREMTSLILKRAPIGDNEEDYDVLENGIVVGRIFKVPVAPEGRPWMWASGAQCRQHPAPGARLCCHARGGDGGVREIVARGALILDGW